MRVYRLVRLRVMIRQNGSRNCGYPSPGADESYVLTIPSTTDALLKSETVWGALRGLETFSQMVQAHPLLEYAVINCGKIQDNPRFSYRSVLIDTARHFLPVPVIKQNLDAMAYNKFNVLHWHIVDDQSWPLHLEAFPNLTLKGAYSPRHVYSPEDVRSIIEYARLRGIRVIPEMDTPGHTQALGKAFPDTLTTCYSEGMRGTAEYGKFAAFEILDPTRELTYHVVHNLLLEIKKLFPDPYVHLGIDEINYKCWVSNPEVAAFMRDHGLYSLEELGQHYMNRTLDSVDQMGLKVMIWQDPIDMGVEAPKKTIIEVWKSWVRPDDVAKKGYQVVMSSPWYLNYFSSDKEWDHFYNTNRTGFDAMPKQMERVIGGEACMWGEYVDMTNLLGALWPRAAAVAERLWSAAHVNKIEEAVWRLNMQRCRMLRRGIPVHPLNSLPCDNNEELDFTEVFVVD
ncbi:beta-hexosaminidase subunit beta-like [Haemaphysalis longicornis]